MNRAAQFDLLFAEHRGAIYAYLFGRTGNPDMAADLLQETFVRVWRNLETVLGVADRERRFYILSFARSCTVDAQRRSRPTVSITAIADKLATADLRGGPELADVDRAIMALPEDLRTVLTMHALGGMSGPEIGTALGRPEGTIRYQLHVARKRLSEVLGLECEQ